MAGHESGLIEPRRGRHEEELPPIGLLCVNPEEAKSVINQLRSAGAVERGLFNAQLMVDQQNRYFAAGPAIGAPMAVMTLEKLIALGARKVVLFGWCGALDESWRIGDVVVPLEGIVGEGTSRYYGGKTVVQASASLSRHIAAALPDQPSHGRIWSTDAIYRELPSELAQLRTEHMVCGVDMEFSALCSVAAFRQIDFAAVLLVSDELYHQRWRPGFKDQGFQTQRKLALSAVLQYLQTAGE